MALNATLPWANSRHYVTCLDGIDIERPDWESDIRPWETEALSFEVNVYVHTETFSAIPDDGVEAHRIYVILSKSSARAKKWRIDSIDSGSLAAYQNARSCGAIGRAVFRAIATEMWKRGFDPSEVMGWRRYMQHWSYEQVLEEALVCK